MRKRTSAVIEEWIKLLDVSVIERAKNNDEYAFRLLFSSCHQKVYKTAYLILRDYQLAEDVVQETFLKVYVSIAGLDEPQAFEKWLYKIAVNLCFNMLRKRGKYEAAPLKDEIEESVRTEEVVIQKEQGKNILRCINTLSTKHASVVILYYFNNFTIEEIAEITKSSEGTVKSRLFYARKLLREAIEKKELYVGEGGSLYGSR